MKRRSLPWILGSAAIGTLVFGVLGYFFGKYALAEVDFVKVFSELRNPDGLGTMTAWLMGMMGLVLGMRWGRQMAHRIDRAQRRKREREEAAQFDPENKVIVASSTRPR